MARMTRKNKSKNKHNFVALILIWIFKGLWYIIKGIFLALKWAFVSLYGLIKGFFERRKANKSSDVDLGSNKEKSNEEKSVFNSNVVVNELKEIETEQGTFDDLKKTLYEKKSTIGLILGARGTGKSALGLRILENISAGYGRNIYAMGFKNIPSWIKVVEKVDDVKNNSFLLIDESGITFSSRNFMSELNKFLGNLLLVARHKDLSVLFITQNSANIDINIIRQLDYMLLKPSSLLQKDFERKKIAEIYKEKAIGFKKHKNAVGLTYVYADSYTGFVSNDLPSFWSEKVSKSFR